MITKNTPFGSLEPLTNYLNSLEQVTEQPSEVTICQLLMQDELLTDRAVLYPQQEFIHREGWRTFGYKSCTVSDGVHMLARLAMHEPGSEAYQTEYRQVFPATAEINPDAALLERRRNTARGALIGLGGKLAVSGAFYGHDIRLAYEAITKSMDTIGQQDEDFTAFGKHRISVDLFEEYISLLQGNVYHNPIGKSEATENIDSAWQAVGRPHGRFTKVVAWLNH